MDIILYNPLSKNGKTEIAAIKLKTDLEQKGNVVRISSLLDIKDINQFLESIQKEDRLILVGGDGTLHRVVNQIYEKKIPNKIFLYKAGTGNDFSRSLKKKGKIVEITDKFQALPQVTINQKTVRFLNGVGIGLDGLVCYKLDTVSKKKSKWNYFKNTISAFFAFKKIKSAEITIDGKSFKEKKIWLTSVMNGPFLGAGMKLAPKANRDNQDLYLVVVKKLPKILLLFILPTVYLGIHTIFLGTVKIYKVQESVSIEFSEETYGQVDGEVEYPLKRIDVKVA